MSTLKLQCLSSTGSQIFSVDEVAGINSSKIINFNNTTNSLNSSTGSVIIHGGLGINSNLYVGSNLIVPNVSVVNSTFSNLLSSNTSISNLIASNTSISNLSVSNITNDILSTNTLNISGNVTIGGNLVVVGSTTIVNITTSNQLEQNVTASSILITGGSLNATFNSNTFGNLFTTGGNVGINNSAPTYQLDISGQLRVSSSTNTGTTGAYFINNNYSSNIVGGISTLAPNLSTGGSFTHYHGISMSNNNVVQLSYYNSGPGSSNNAYNVSFYGGGSQYTFTQNGFGINNSTPSFNLDVVGNARISNSLTTGSLFSSNLISTNISNSNLISTNILSNNVTLSNLISNNVTFSNLISNNISSTNLTSSNAIFNSLSALNISLTNVSTSNSNIVNATIQNLISSNLSNLNLISTNISNTNLISINHTSSNLVSTNVLFTNATINNNSITNATIQSLTATTSTIPNIIHTNVTTTNLISTNVNINGILNANFNSNTLGNLYTTGGNVGINTTNPTNALDVIGEIRALNLTPSVGQNDMIRFGQSESNNNMALIDYNYSTIGSSLNSIGLGFYGGNNKLVVAASGNVGINNSTPAYILDVAGSVNISGTTLNMNGTNPAILYNTSGVNAPTFTTRSAGTKIVLFPNLTSTQLDYSIGIETNSMWMTSNGLFKWYINSTTSNFVLSTSGTILNANNSNASYNITNSTKFLDLALALNSGSYSTSAFAGDTVLRTSVGQNLILQTNAGGSANMIIASSGNISMSGNLNLPSYGYIQMQTGNTQSYLTHQYLTTSQHDYLALATNFIRTDITSGSITSSTLPTAEIGLYTGGQSGSNPGANIVFSHSGMSFGTVPIERMRINTAGNVGINTSTPKFNLDVNGIINSTQLTTGSLFVLNAFVNNITANTVQISGNASISNLLSNNSTLNNLICSNITTSNLSSTMISTTNITSLNNTITNLVSSNLTSSNLNVSNLNASNLTSGIINVTGLTASNINFTGSLFKNGSLFISSQWNTFGNNLVYTTGNVGINTTSPSFTLDVNGQTRVNAITFSTSNTFGALIVSGGISIVATNASSNSAGGGLTISGGAAILQDTYIGGNLFIQGINSSVISGNKLLTSNSSTGTFQVTVTTPRTLLNNTYKIVGSTSTLSSNTAVFAVSFSSLTINSFIANIYRIDALGSSWALTDLTLNYNIYP